MIRYLLVDEDGQLHEKTAPEYRAALADCGPEGWDRQPLAPDLGVAAFLNDCGLVMPDRYRRNVVAACMMVTLGAPARAYAGPVVFTGWKSPSAGVEVRSLTDGDVHATRSLWRDVRVVLGLDAGELTWESQAPSWAEGMRGYAEWMPTAAFQGPTILTGDDALDALRGRRDG